MICFYTGNLGYALEPVVWEDGMRRVWGARRREVDLRRGRRAERSGQAAVEAGLLGCTKWAGHHFD